MKFVALWCLLFVISLGPGYPTLNRYDWTRVDSNAVLYHEMVVHGSEVAPPLYAHRILIPYAARPFFKLAENHIGSWDAGYLGLLIINAIFMSGAAALLFVIASRLADINVALVTWLLYLLNFAVPNLFLAGLVDSGEAFFLAALIWGALRRQWWIVPFAVILGSLAKETFLVFAVAFLVTWAVADPSPQRARRLIFAGIGAALGGIALLATIHATGGTLTTFVSDGSWNLSKLQVAVAALSHRNFWYAFALLLSLGTIHLGKAPRAWRYSTGTAATLALILAAYHTGSADAGPELAGPTFAIAAPPLTYSMASFLCTMFSTADAAVPRSP